MEIGAGDVEAARGKRLVPLVITHGGDGKLDFVVTQLTLEGTGGMVVADIDNVLEGAFFVPVMLLLDVEVFSADYASGSQNDGALDNVLAARERCPATGRTGGLRAPPVQCAPSAFERRWHSGAGSDVQ